MTKCLIQRNHDMFGASMGNIQKKNQDYKIIYKDSVVIVVWRVSIECPIISSNDLMIERHSVANNRKLTLYSFIGYICGIIYKKRQFSLERFW